MISGEPSSMISLQLSVVSWQDVTANVLISYLLIVVTYQEKNIRKGKGYDRSIAENIFL